MSLSIHFTAIPGLSNMNWFDSQPGGYRYWIFHQGIYLWTNTGPGFTNEKQLEVCFNLGTMSRKLTECRHQHGQPTLSQESDMSRRCLKGSMHYS